MTVLTLNNLKKGVKKMVMRLFFFAPSLEEHCRTWLHNHRNLVEFRAEMKKKQYSASAHRLQAVFLESQKHNRKK